MTERVEQQKSNSEHASQEVLERHAMERKEQLREQIERRAETSRERGPERASHEVEREAKELARSAKKELQHTDKETAPVERRREKLIRNKKTLDASFDREMKDIRTHMPATSRTFSKIIHHKSIEQASEVVGKTVARPNAILAGSTFALIFTVALYFWAKNAGYPLSGFETIAAFIVGWLCGIIFDFARIAVTGKS